MAENNPELPKALKVSSGSDEPALLKGLQRRKTVTIGRAHGCDVVIKDVKASRRHCRLTRSEAGFVLEDLNSKNGTLVDGAKITSPVELKLNQTFKIGDPVFYLAS